ncbi:MAG: hypothetical protein IPL61_38980 [Myxococcales bacterium]|nr:hypothetical protein [Myxococcales bacterium]
MRLVDGAPASGWQPSDIARVTWQEDGGDVPGRPPGRGRARSTPASSTTCAADGTDTPVATKLRHGAYSLVAPAAPAAPRPADRLTALPTY